MASVKDIIEINITRDTRGISRQGFGIPLFLGNTAGVFGTGEYIRTYTDADAVMTDFGDTSPEYEAAQRFFGQEIEPTYIKIGYHNTTDVDVNGDPLESLTEALVKIREQDNDWYFITAHTHATADILEIAEYAETNTVIYGTSYSGADALDATSNLDPGSQLQLKAFSRTFIMYAADHLEYPECAIIGLQATKAPGSTTWKFKELVGVTPSKLSTTQSIVLKGTKYDYGKGYNTYEPTGGRNIFAEGRVVNSEFIDVMRFADWLEARMRERIYLTLVNMEKVPYTSAGFAIIEGRMREVLNNGVAVGGLASYKVTVPDPRSLDPNSRANRVATGFAFTGVLAGAVHFVEINGNLQI